MVEKVQQKIIIPETLATQRFDSSLAKLFPQFSRTQLQAWLADGKILLDGKVAKGKIRIKGGEAVELDVTIEPKGEWQAEAIPLDVVFEDDSLLIINKPPKFVVHPGAGNKDKTLLNALLHHAPELRLLPRAGIVHRLDKDTSGLLVVAKTDQALKNLQHQLKKHHVLREYQAIVQGNIISGGSVNAAIGRHHIQRKRMAITDSGKPSVTHYRVAEKFRVHTLLKLQLETGRTHQIRVHMAYIQHPIIGDPIYGGRLRITKNMSTELVEKLRLFRRQALHAWALSFAHPKTKESLRFEVPLPEDMKNLISLLREDTKLNA